MISPIINKKKLKNKTFDALTNVYGWEFVKVLPFTDLYKVYYNHKRLKVFAQKGLECVHPECDKVGTLLLITQEAYPNSALHIDVYTEDCELMNVDHIIPKSKGGHKTDINNMQPMCEYHNTLKTNNLTKY